MPKSRIATMASGCAEATASEPMLVILEKQLMRTFELAWHVEQARTRSNGELSEKARSLFAGMANELQSFSQMIGERIESLKSGKSSNMRQPCIARADVNSHWRLFRADSADLHEQLESLLCGYARYARETSAASVSLQRLGDIESSRILAAIMSCIDRCLWFIEIYLEGLALKTDGSRLPDWSPTYVDLRK